MLGENIVYTASKKAVLNVSYAYQLKEKYIQVLQNTETAKLPAPGKPSSVSTGSARVRMTIYGFCT